jgi:UDPglucose 6-dehydrogenase
MRTARDFDYPLDILDAVERVNAAQKRVLGKKIAGYFEGRLSGRTVAIWGLSFKPNTDDMREAPSLTLIHDLIDQGARVVAYDPVAMQEARRVLGPDDRIHYAENPMAALKGADCLAIVTEWKEFRSPDFERIAQTLKQPVIFDGRNLYDPAAPRAAGLRYFAMGRG